MSQQARRKFPGAALLIGGIGTVLAILGILAYSTPDLAVRISPLLGQSMVADALIAMGALLMALEMILILQWIRRKPRAQTKAADAAVVRVRDRL